MAFWEHWEGLGHTGSYWEHWDVLGHTGEHWDLPGHTGTGSTGREWGGLGHTGRAWDILGYTGTYWDRENWEGLGGTVVPKPVWSPNQYGLSNWCGPSKFLRTPVTSMALLGALGWTGITGAQRKPRPLQATPTPSHAPYNPRPLQKHQPFKPRPPRPPRMRNAGGRSYGACALQSRRRSGHPRFCGSDVRAPPGGTEGQRGDHVTVGGG